MSTDVVTPVYEGPFDMLLQLILRDQVDIYEVSLSTIVDAYLTELDKMRDLDLDVLTLVVTHRDLVRVVQQDVGGLQGGVREQAGRDEVALVGLVLELRHPGQLAEADVALHHPRQLAVLGHVALDEHRGDVGVEADGEEARRQLDGALADDAGLLGDGQGVEVDDAVERVHLVLGGGPSPQRPQVVAEVDVTGGLHARQDTGHAEHSTDPSVCCSGSVCGGASPQQALRRRKHAGPPIRDPSGTRQ